MTTHGGLFATLLAATLSIRRRGDEVFDRLQASERQLQAQAIELRKARDEALATVEAKQMFLANMSHEIRTPLNGIIGMSDVMLSMGLDPEPRKSLKTIAKSGRTLLAVVNDVLDFSRLDSNNVALESIPFSPFQLVEDVLEVFGHVTWRKGIDLCSDIDPDGMPEQVFGDEIRLRQTLLNLVGNAVKFTSEGAVTVAASHDGTNLILSVSDTGVGIPEEAIGRLFQDFSQVDPSTTRRFGGTGLGLAITSRLATLMGGTVNVESTEGEGSTFVLTVPAEAIPPSVRQEHDETLPPHYRLLYVSPFAGSLKTFAQLSKRLGLDSGSIRPA